MTEKFLCNYIVDIFDIQPPPLLILSAFYQIKVTVFGSGDYNIIFCILG